MDKQPIERFALHDVPQFQRFQAANPQNPNIGALQAATMYGRAIHWISMLDLLWPDMEKMDHLSLEVAYIVVNDPDEHLLPHSFYEYIARRIAMFWEMQLKERYPNGDWAVEIDDDPEMTVYFKINSRG